MNIIEEKTNVGNKQQITMKHFRTKPETLGFEDDYTEKGLRVPAIFVGERLVNVSEIHVEHVSGMDGQSGYAVLPDGTHVPWSQIFHRGSDQRRISCVNDDTGQRWS